MVFCEAYCSNVKHNIIINGFYSIVLAIEVLNINGSKFALFQTLCLLELFIGLMGVWIILEDLVIPMCCCVEEDENENLPLLPHQAEPAVSEGEKLRGACEDRAVHCLSSVKSCCNRLCAGKLNNRLSQVVNDEELLPLSPS